MITKKQMEANQRNAQQSTGPKTEEGKARSRMNGVIHGLAAKELISPEAETEYSDKLDRWKECYPVQTVEEELALGIVVENSLRIERGFAALRVQRTKLIRTATDMPEEWTEERNFEAFTLGESLKRNPKTVAKKLRRSVEGRRWLRAEWIELQAAVQPGETSRWNPDRTVRAMNLLGIKPEDRELKHELHEIFKDQANTHEFISAQIATLDDELTHGDQELEYRRDLQARGYELEDDPRTKLIRRYERSHLRDYYRALDSLAHLKKLKSEQTKPRQEVPTKSQTKEETKEESQTASVSAEVSTPGNPKADRITAADRDSSSHRQDIAWSSLAAATRVRFEDPVAEASRESYLTSYARLYESHFGRPMQPNSAPASEAPPKAVATAVMDRPKTVLDQNYVEKQLQSKPQMLPDATVTSKPAMEFRGNRKQRRAQAAHARKCGK